VRSAPLPCSERCRLEVRWGTYAFLAPEREDGGKEFTSRRCPTVGHAAVPVLTGTGNRTKVNPSIRCRFAAAVPGRPVPLPRLISVLDRWLAPHRTRHQVPQSLERKRLTAETKLQEAAPG
jgi:hypothetical protein